MQFNIEQTTTTDAVIKDIVTAFVDSHGRAGTHTTDCLLCLRKASWDRHDPLPPTPDEILYYVLGLGLQQTLGISARVSKVVDGVILSPDYWDEEKLVLLELKTTRISPKRIKQFAFPKHWLKQVMAYCYGFGVRRCSLLILTLIQPDLIPITCTFTTEELQKNWDMILWNASLLQSTTPMFLPQGEEWECKYCRYALRCKVAKRM